MSIDGSSNENGWSDVLEVSVARVRSYMCTSSGTQLLVETKMDDTRIPCEQRNGQTYILCVRSEDGFEIGLRSKVMRVSSAIKMQRLRSLRWCVACVDSFEKLIRFAGVSLSLSLGPPFICESASTMKIRSHTFDTSSANTFAHFSFVTFCANLFLVFCEPVSPLEDEMRSCLLRCIHIVHKEKKKTIVTVRAEANMGNAISLISIFLFSRRLFSFFILFFIIFAGNTLPLDGRHEKLK